MHKTAIPTRLPLTLSSLVLLLLLSAFTTSGCQPIQRPPADTSSVETTTLSQVNAPIRLSIPALEIESSVTPMGWRVVETNNIRTTEWIVPDDAVGWHVNSAGVGEAGNMILSGHQALGSAIFAPIAAGQVKAGQEIIVTGADGAPAHYRVADVSAPIPIDGASAEEQNQVNAYMEQSDEPRLTLITGWPTFTTSHRVFVVASPLAE